MNGGPINGFVSFAHGKLFGDTESFAMPYHHANNAVVGNPAVYIGIDAHACEAYLASWAVLVLVGKSGKFFFVSAPAHFRSCRAFFSKSFNTPCVQEFVH